MICYGAILNLEDCRQDGANSLRGSGRCDTWPSSGRSPARRNAGRACLLQGTENGSQSIVSAFREGLATFGSVEATTCGLIIASPAAIPAVSDAEELVNLRPDVVFAFTGRRPEPFSSAHQSSRSCSWGAAIRPQVLWCAT
jgi:hypothetical protein